MEPTTQQQPQTYTPSPDPFVIAGGTLGGGVLTLALVWVVWRKKLAQLFPKVFAGQLDEVIDLAAEFVLQAPGYQNVSPKNLTQALRDPSQLAQLITSSNAAELISPVIEPPPDPGIPPELAQAIREIIKAEIEAIKPEQKKKGKAGGSDV